MSLELSYVLPLRWDENGDSDELTAYLRWLSGVVELIVVDGSPPEIFNAHASSWAGLGMHVKPDPDVAFLNGKVDGVFTGVRRARFEAVVIADDDVRYDEEALERLACLLHDNDLVRPQNYFDPMPWHALWDSSRSLLNRAFAADFPGTLGIRRSFFMAMGGYDGDVMFENLELIRTIEAAGGRGVAPLDLFVARIPPSSRAFWSQRIRQAYDDLASPWRLTMFLSLGPLTGAAVATGRKRPVAAAAATAIALAEIGRRRAGGRSAFPPAASAFAPLWISERALCSWLAVGFRVGRGGVRYRRGIIPKAA
ncbi:MAG: glycosyltransferase family 2 protein, partial [Actinomycetota bacterium]|nr:glycosyltransferase family 2 protein [Actinomycetota bacterium]